MQYLVFLILAFFSVESLAVLNNLKEIETSQDRVAASDATKSQGYHYNNGDFTEQYLSATPSPPIARPTPTPAPYHQHNFDGYNYQVPITNHAAFSLGGTPLYQHSRETPAFAVNLQNDHNLQKPLENAATFYIPPAGTNIAAATAVVTATQNNNRGVYFVPRQNHQFQQPNNGYKYEKPQAASISNVKQNYKDSPSLLMDYNYQRPTFESQRNTAETYTNQNMETSFLNVAQNYKDFKVHLFANDARIPQQTGYDYQRPVFEPQKNIPEIHTNQFDSQFSSINPPVSGNQFGFNFNRGNEVNQQENSAAANSAITTKEDESYFKPNYFSASVSVIGANTPRTLFEEAPPTATTKNQASNKQQYKNIGQEVSTDTAEFQQQTSYNDYLKSRQRQINDASSQYTQSSHSQAPNDELSSPTYSNYNPDPQQQTQNSGYIYTSPSAAYRMNSVTTSNFRGQPTQTYGSSHTTAINDVADQNVAIPAATHITGNTENHAEPNQFLQESPESSNYANTQNGLGHYKYASNKPFAFDSSPAAQPAATTNLLSGEHFRPINKPYDYLQMQSLSYELPSAHYTMLSTSVPTAPQTQQQQEPSNNIFSSRQEQQQQPQQQSYNSYLTPAYDQQTSFAASVALPVRQPHIIYGTPIAAAAPTISPSNVYQSPRSEFQLPYLK